MSEEYKNKQWLKEKLVDDEVSMAKIGRQFNCDITTIRYWRDKHNIEINKNPKYPIKKYSCPVCDKEFEKRVTKNIQAVYCSQKCAYIGRSLGYTIRRVEGGYNTHPTKVGLVCKFCDKEFIVKKTNKGRKYCSRECFLKSHKKRMCGKKNPAWTGGGSYEKRSYRGYNWSEQRKKCYKRDNYMCCICNIKCIGRKNLNKDKGKKLVQCHHIKKFQTVEDNELNNLITLCASCHKKLHERGIEYEMD